MAAADSGHEAVVLLLLLNCGANVDAQDKDRRTTLR